LCAGGRPARPPPARTGSRIAVPPMCSTSARRWSILSDRCMPSASASVSGFWRLWVACARRRSRNQRGCQTQVREACVRCPLFLVRAVTAIMGTVVGVTFLFGFGCATRCCCCGWRWKTVHCLAVVAARVKLAA
jgi:hypothetical protein